MSVAEAEEFYGPVRDVLKKALAGTIGERAQGHSQLRAEYSRHARDAAADWPVARADRGRAAVQQHRQFMTGHVPAKPRARRERSRARKSASSLYMRGSMPCAKSARSSGRPIPPRRLPDRSGANSASTIMVNAAHASDSTDNARREMGIVKIRENNFKSLIESFYQD